MAQVILSLENFQSCMTIPTLQASKERLSISSLMVYLNHEVSHRLLPMMGELAGSKKLWHSLGFPFSQQVSERSGNVQFLSFSQSCEFFGCSLAQWS